MDIEEFADATTELLMAQMSGNKPHLFHLLRQLSTQSRGHILGVTLTCAACVADDMPLGDGEEFHALSVTVGEADGTWRQGSADDLPPHARTFFQMVVAIANDDPQTARDLYVGFVGDDAIRAMRLIGVALGFASNHLAAAARDLPGAQS